MKVKIELFGASRDFSSHNSLDLNLNNNSTIKTNMSVERYEEIRHVGR